MKKTSIEHAGVHAWVGRVCCFAAFGCAAAALAPRLGFADGSKPPNAALRPVAHELAGAPRSIDRVSEQGQRAHGLYFNAPVQRRLGAKGIVHMLRASNMDAAVLDLKDGEGRVNWDTQIESLKPQKHRYHKDMPAFIAELKGAGIYTIGRVVCFSDPYLPRNEPDRAVLDDRPGHKGQVWANWGKRNPWLDPYNTRNHDLLIAIAKEVEALGLDEIQFDYIRFPVDRATRFALFPAKTEAARQDVLIGMLKRIDEAINIPIGADVFGVTAYHEGDPEGLGQVPEAWAEHVEVFTPMLYLDGMGSWRSSKGNPQGRAERLIYAGIKNLRRRLGNGPVLRPFLQAFARGADYYNEHFIAEQIRASRDAGGDGFLFWSPSSSYRVVQSSMATAASGLAPFPIVEQSAWRRDAWGALDRRAETEAPAEAPASAPTPVAESTSVIAEPKAAPTAAPSIFARPVVAAPTEPAAAIAQPAAAAPAPAVPAAAAPPVDSVTRASQAQAGALR